MLLVLSPAKSLDFDTPLPFTLAQQACNQPLFTAQAQQLMDLLRPQSPQEIASLLSISDKLAALNVARYLAWSPRATPQNARPAVLAFDGDVYVGLDARSLGTKDLAWAQEHLCILSGLYGVLRPLDLMQAYRLEMGTRLANPAGRDLYTFWGRHITDYLNTRLRSTDTTHPVLVNLASQEYFKAVKTPLLQAMVVECVFEETKGGPYKIISFAAKRARGLMARFAIQHQLTRPEQLRAFDAEGYTWNAALSSPERLVFRRRVPLPDAHLIT